MFPLVLLALAECQTGGLAGGLVDWRTGGPLADWRTADWRTEWRTEWRTGGPADWRTGGLADWRTVKWRTGGLGHPWPGSLDLLELGIC